MLNHRFSHKSVKKDNRTDLFSLRCLQIVYLQAQKIYLRETNANKKIYEFMDID